VRVYALVESGDPKEIDVFLREDDARRALEECLRDEPQWESVLSVQAVDLSSDRISPN
jgi:hypothetical protein